MPAHRILYVTEAPVYGGAERYLLILMQGLNRSEFEPSIALHLDAPDQLVEGLKDIQVPGHRVAPIHGKADLGGLLKQRTFFKNQAPDIVHFNLSNPLHGQYSMLAARWAGIPIQIATMHLPPRATTPTWRGQFLEKRTVCSLNRLISVSGSSRNLVIQHFRMPEDRVVAVHNGLDPDVFNHPAASPAELGLPWDRGPLIGTVGRMTEQKAQDVLLNAASIVQREAPNAKFVIVGEGPLHDDLVRQQTDLGLDDNVFFSGQRTDIPALLAAFDLFVLPSRYESFPFTILEAMAAGLPVVVTDVDGVSEAVVDGQHGHIVPRDNPERLAKAILNILNNPDLAKEMGQKSRTRIQEHFTQAHMVAQTEDVYRQCLPLA